MKIVNFRFDVDTHRCMREGVPNLLDLSRKHNCHFTFFVNMGRAVSLRQSLSKKTNKPQPVSTDINLSKFSPMKKLGLLGYIQAALINPKVGFGSLSVLRKLIDEGHEFGLHGGSNHSLWARNAPEWDYDYVRNELKTTLDQISKRGFPTPKSFASPGFAGSQTINKALLDLGFDYVSDTYSKTGKNDGEGLFPSDTHLNNLNVNITNGNGIAFIENLRSMGKTDQEIVTVFQEKLSQIDQYGIVYEHPGYAGISELDLLDKLILASKDMGFKVGTSREIYENCLTVS